ncbi:MAG TPA: ABC transporter permease [Kouleothrix sp.]|uniref:ABC transporter permease n=1 Tax=Kouleothrix sp. TaxID=2779161 RepID=UPI002B75D4E5|nr:ABC transporter permease [Kouleothrix sp.]HRC75677.1 ABC transporter permease [Kouleothrix sp.]
MLAFFIRRVLWAIPVIFFVGLVSFFLMHQAPGGPFDKDNNKKQVDGATLKALNARFGLDKPQYVNPVAARALWASGERNPLRLARTYLDSQFFNYMLNAVRGDLGPSYRQRGKSVQDILIKQAPFSMRLGLLAFSFALIAGIPLGILAALKQNSLIDYLSLLLSTIGVAVPSFVTGLLVIIVFGTTLKWISITNNNWNEFQPYLAPALVLGLTSMSFITRITRTTLLEVKRQDYIRTARAKGLAERSVVSRHMMRNALIPIVTIIGPGLVDLITGSVITEAIFGIPGIGNFFVNSLFQRDYSMIMGTTLVYATLIVFANILVDLSYGLLDPRIRA